MDENDGTTPGPVPAGDGTPERTPRELFRFRDRIARGWYDRAWVARVIARRLLARGDLDPPPPGADVPDRGS